MKLSCAAKYCVCSNMFNTGQGHFIFTGEFQGTTLGYNVRAKMWGSQPRWQRCAPYRTPAHVPRGLVKVIQGYVITEGSQKQK